MFQNPCAALVTIPQKIKNCLSRNCFSLRCKYLVKEFPACCFILKNGNSWRKAQLIRSKKSKSRPFFSWSGNSWFPGRLATKNHPLDASRDAQALSASSPLIFMLAIKKVLLTKNFFIGAPLGTRTPNLRIRSALLYPIELIALIQFTTLIIIH